MISRKIFYSFRSAEVIISQIPLTAYIWVILIGLSGCSASNKEDIYQYFNRNMEKSGFVGLQAAYIEDGELAWSGSFGKKNLNTGEEVNDSTVFMIASCSKPVTALGMIKLFDQGQIDLDDDINDYLPFKIVNPNFPEKTITIRMLLTHTSSLMDNWDVMTPLYTLQSGGGDSPISLLQLNTDYFLKGGTYYNEDKNFAQYEPGSQKAYCNMGYALTGLLIEMIAGDSFPAYMQKEVFNPLNMHNTYWLLADIPNENIARPHEIKTDDTEQVEYKVLDNYGYPDYPDGQIRTTVRDYAQILKLMVNNGMVNGKPFVREETIQEMLRIQYPDVNKYQAISWNYNEFDHWLYYLLNPRLPAHTGVDPGVATVTCFDPVNKTGAVIFLNNSAPSSFETMKLFYMDMVKRLLNEYPN
jgi:CubicO group peptidase (beta-lactamase class C family)